MEIRISPIYGENYEVQWGKADYANKIVLDIGGSNGDTSDFFLRKGAILCICVDSNKDYITQCKNAVKALKIPILPIHKSINNTNDWESMITLINPDIVKSDCEGGELSLFDINDEIFKLVPEYIIETHDSRITKKMIEKCNICGYDIIDINNWTSDVSIVYVKRK